MIRLFWWRALCIDGCHVTTLLCPLTWRVGDLRVRVSLRDNLDTRMLFDVFDLFLCLLLNFLFEIVDLFLVLLLVIFSNRDWLVCI
jgi:hypothetical protein